MKKKLYEVDLDKDMRYRGPLSYRHFKILGWILLAVSQIAVLLGVAAKIDASIYAEVATPQLVINLAGSLSLPLLLIANFSLILDDSDGYANVLKVNGVVTALIIFFFSLVYFRYVVGALGFFTGGTQNADSLLNGMFSSYTRNGYFSFNIFMDLFLCALFMFFLNYRPQKLQGKKLLAFRLLAILPVSYEVLCLVLKILASNDLIMLPVGSYPFLTTKPPILLLVFIILALYLKRREVQFCKNGRTYEEYRKFQQTNRNSFQFSRFAAIVFVIAGGLDFVLYVFLLVFSMIKTPNIIPDVNNPAYMEYITAEAYRVANIGFGQSCSLVLMAPLMLLFSYTRKHKTKVVDYAIPIIGMGLIVFIYLEGILRAIYMLPKPDPVQWNVLF